MDIKFETMTEEHSREVMDIFNYYVENSFAAYLEQKLPYEFFDRLRGMAGGYPFYAIKNADGRFHNIGRKKGEYFDVLWMEKEIK